MIEMVNRLTEDMRNRVRLMVGRAILSVVNDAGAIQTAQAQLLADEVQDDAERIQEYGFTSVPLPGAEAVLAFVGGNRDHGLIIAVDDRRYRLTGLAGGEVAIYDDLGQKVHLTRDGIVVDGAGKQITFTNTPKVRIEAQLEVTQNIVGQQNITATQNIADQGGGTGKTMASMRSTYNSHTHNDPQGGTVNTPNQAM
ncbi:phage baseplate assembly protein V [Noviherbaspirillum humi]|uniref:Phage baseplate assembly protein V n=1 Tax=Noviherbaspirillum humi TaxID=1688639 RepID=A0A239LF10_9BURK|nr:phage baseplate assembly protein V [Noviherbaspirillum humi]SNT29061.1 phage baseplate assembly protein V [Noviherbaspirillum humi]